MGLVSLLLLATLGTSIASLALGPNSRMTRPGATVEISASSLSKAAATVEQLGNLEKAPINVHTGYVGWSDASGADAKPSSLRALGEAEPVQSQKARIVGYVVLGMLLLSAVAAFFGVLGACCCGCSGCALATFAIPFGLALIATMLAYYFIVNKDVSAYAKATYPEIPAEKTVRGGGGRARAARSPPPPTPTLTRTLTPSPPQVVQYPGWAWYTGAASGLLWLLSGLIGCCMPAKTRKVTTVV